MLCVVSHFSAEIWYRQFSNISSGTKSQNLNVYRLALQLPLPNPLKPGAHLFMGNTVKQSGGRLNKKDGLTRYGNCHVKDKTS